MYQIKHYITVDQQDVIAQWLRKLKDTSAKVAIVRRANRIEQGNFGDCKYCRDGVWELRVNLGAGYRIYYAIEDQQVVLLLCGGDKRTQEADIVRACAYWQDWQRRE